MSTLKVDSLIEKTSGNGVHIAGHVIQVVNASYGTQANSSSSAFTDTGLTATITPYSSSSKILISANITGVRKLSNNTFVQLRLVRNSSGLIHIESSAGRDGTTGDNAVGGVATSYLDSPVTTSATTYKVQFSSANNNAEVVVQVAGNTASTSTITLMEIAQ